MYAGQLVFSQVMQHMPMRRFHTCVDRYSGDRRIRTFSCRDQLTTMAFAQLTYRESLRDIITCLSAMRAKLYHMGITGNLAKSTLADANNTRHWRIYADFAAILIQQARDLYGGDGDLPEGLNATAYALDSTTIDLSLTLFPWAQFRRRKSAVKVHTLLDLQGSIPRFVHITGGKTTDNVAMDAIPIEPGAFYILQMDQAAFADQGFLRHVGERREDADMDRCGHVRSDFDFEKAAGSRSEPLHNSTGSEPHPFREKAHFTGVF